MRNKMTLAGTIVALGLAASTLVIPSFAQPMPPDDSTGANEATDKPTSAAGAESVMRVASAMQLIRYAREYESPVAMLAAVEMMQTVRVRESETLEGTLEAMDSSADPSAGKVSRDAQPPVLEAETLLAEAREWAAGNPEILEMIDTAMDKARDRPRSAVTMGAVGGPKYNIERAPARTAVNYDINFEAGKLARIAVIGDSDTDLDLIVLDQNGNRITADVDDSDFCIVQWTPRWTGDFRIVVVNHGSVWNEYIIVTN
ncbi:MAG: hypothetical protein RLN76_05340 [Phycisphaeraceae bacterium]